MKIFVILLGFALLVSGCASYTPEPGEYQVTDQDSDQTQAP